MQFAGLTTTESGAHNIDSRPVPSGYMLAQPRRESVLGSGYEVDFGLGDHPKTSVPHRRSWRLTAPEHH